MSGRAAGLPAGVVGGSGAGLVKRSFTLAGHRTSVALETEFWTALAAIARPRAVSALVAELDAARTPTQPLASLLRLHALRHYMGLAVDGGCDRD